MNLKRPYVVVIDNAEGGTDRIVVPLVIREALRLHAENLIKGLRQVIHCSSERAAEETAARNIGPNDYPCACHSLSCLLQAYSRKKDLSEI